MLLLFSVTRARSHVQTATRLACEASLRMAINAAQNSLGGRGGGSVVIVGDGDLLVLLGLQLALIEAERPFKNVFDLTDKQTRKKTVKTHHSDEHKTRPDLPA